MTTNLDGSPIDRPSASSSVLIVAGGILCLVLLVAVTIELRRRRLQDGQSVQPACAGF